MKNLLIRIKLFFIRLKIKILRSYDSTFYVNGADTLPPPLSAAEESEALSAAAHSSRYRSLLIEHNLRLVVYIAKKFESTGIGIEDLVSIGTIGLIKAINTFNPLKNIKISSGIKNETIEFTNLKAKHLYDNYISSSKCDKIINEVLLGG